MENSSLEKQGIARTFPSEQSPVPSDLASQPGLGGKRVLMLFPHMVTPGGALNYMLKLSELLVLKGATLGILTLQADMEKYGSIKGVEILRIDGPLTSEIVYWLFFPFWQKKIRRKILDWQPDVLVPHVFPANWWAWLHKKRESAIPVVWICPEPSAFIHSQDWIEALKPFWKKYMARAMKPVLAFADIKLSRFSDKIVVNSKYTAGMLEKVYHRKADAVAYPGIDLIEFHPENSIEKQEIIVTVAKLSKFKRIDFLLQVFSRLLKRYPQLVYHIVGQGEEEKSLKKLAAELHISDKVIFHGITDNQHLAALHQRALLFLHGSIAEPFGMAPLEAIACNTPVIAHSSGGPLEFVNDSCGRLIDSLSKEKWCEEIDNFLSRLKANPEYFRGIEENARKFSWDSTLAPALLLISNVVTAL